MFKKAVDAHGNAHTSNSTLPKGPVLGFTQRNDPLRSVNANSAAKRTASGLSKSTSFKDSLSSGSQNAPIDLENYSDMTKPQATALFFDENDFDDADDSLLLAAEDLSKKSTVSYPKLPSPPKASVAYPQLKRDFHSQAAPTQDSGYSADTAGREVSQSLGSQTIPWSSSPTEHYRSPKRSRFFDATGASTSLPATTVPPMMNAPAQEPQPQAPPPTKRRTLPWLQADQENNEELKTPNKENASRGAPEDSSGNSPYAWNTTASAVKEQQKLLKKANASKKQALFMSNDTGKDVKPASTKNKQVQLTMLSEEQKHVLSLVVDEGKSVFFTGSAGTGKSVLLREIISVLKKKYVREVDRIAVTASTGLAACNIGGVTLHSFAGIGIGRESVEELAKKVKRNQKVKQRWMRTKVLVIDEISMVDGDLFDKLEELARRIRSNGRPFGGIKLVVTGDFFQLPPVPERGGVAKFSFDAATWNQAIDHTIGLHKVFRQKDPVFAGMLNEMREGRLSQQTVNAFRRLARPLPDIDDLAATELFPTRGEVERANQTRMSLLHGKSQVYEARDGGTVVDKVGRDRLLASCIAPERLELKKGAQVMLIKNIDDTLVNGSLGKIVGFMTEAQFELNRNSIESESLNGGNEEDLERNTIRNGINASLLSSTGQLWPKVRFAIADGTTRDILLERESWKVELPNGEIQASRSQVPLILAWALSIHKAQGQTLERVKVDLGKVFEKGQAYVALSRATSTAGLQVLRFDPTRVLAHERVRTFYAGLSKAEHLGNSSYAPE